MKYTLNTIKQKNPRNYGRFFKKLNKTAGWLDELN